MGWDNDKDLAAAAEAVGLAEFERNNSQLVEWAGEMYPAWRVQGTLESAEHSRLSIEANKLFRAKRDADVNASLARCKSQSSPC